VKLLAEALMLLESALRANGRSDFEAGEIADHRDAAKIAVLLRYHDDRDRIPVTIINE